MKRVVLILVALSLLTASSAIAEDQMATPQALPSAGERKSDDTPGGDKETVSLEEARIIQDYTAVIPPEMITRADFSSSDVNRIVCQEPIKDVVFSKEKGISVKVQGKNAFVKFLITVKNGEEVYSNTPSEFYVVCEGVVYSIIAIPKRIPAQTVLLSSGKKAKVEKNLSIFAGMPFEKKVLKLLKQVYTDDIPDSYTIDDTDIDYSLFQEIMVKLSRTVVVEGEGLRVKEYLVTFPADAQKEHIEIREKNFLRKELVEHPVAVSIEKLRLKRGDKVRVFVVEKTAEWGGSNG